MEIKTSEIIDFIQFKIKFAKQKELNQKFITWFESRLMSAELPYDNMNEDQLYDAQNAAQALCSKVEYMLSNSYGGRCDMDSIFRMLYRICEKGVKLIPDRRYEMCYFYDYKNCGINSRHTIGGYKRIKSHFRWNFRTYRLEDAYVSELCSILRDIDYLSLNEDAQMCSLFE